MGSRTGTRGSRRDHAGRRRSSRRSRTRVNARTERLLARQGRLLPATRAFSRPMSTKGALMRVGRSSLVVGCIVLLALGVHGSSALGQDDVIKIGMTNSFSGGLAQA